MTDTVIDLVLDNTYVEPEPYDDDDGTIRHEFSLSPKPECYEKLNQYFAEIAKDRLVELLKLNFNQAGS